MTTVKIRALLGSPPEWQDEGSVSFDGKKLTFTGVDWLRNWVIVINEKGDNVQVDPNKEPEKWINNLYREFRGRTFATKPTATKSVKESISILVDESFPGHAGRPGEVGGSSPSRQLFVPQVTANVRLRKTRISKTATAAEREKITAALARHDPRVLSRATSVSLVDLMTFELVYGQAAEHTVDGKKSRVLAFYRNGQIVMNRDAIYRMTPGSLQSTLDHELGHALWRGTPMATRGVWTRKWRADPEFGRFTAYSRSTVPSNRIGEEAFAETYMAYVGAGGKAVNPKYKEAFAQVDNFLAHVRGRAVGGRVVRNVK